jgi:dephospho-CoA kinase
MSLIIGLTGGIGSGKSSVAELFKAQGVDIIDTDRIAHELTQPAGGAIDAIRSMFGDDFIMKDNSLDRVLMRKLIFSDKIAKQKLESILHPFIFQETMQRIPLTRSEYIILVVPLLLETENYLKLIDRILVVDCPESIQIIRTIMRSKLNEQSVQAIMASQCSRKERLARADDVIVNDLDRQHMQRQVQMLHSQYLAIARYSS